ncbi:MAG: hypothetical protein JST26_09475 [Bacteroidetes bacterium]|nr:hypothetical protein [Bacteroidota bacterium]
MLKPTEKNSKNSGAIKRNLLTANSVSEFKKWQIIYMSSAYEASIPFLASITGHQKNTVRRIIQEYNKSLKSGKKVVVKKSAVATTSSKQLSERDLQLIRLICKGKKSREIALDFGLSMRTVEGLREKLYAKIKAEKVADVIMYAVKRKLV